MDFMLVEPNGNIKKRRADFYEAFGNFAVTHFRYKGKRVCGFFESFERIDGYPVIRSFVEPGKDK